MNSYLRRYFYTILAAATYMAIHEDADIIQALYLGVFEGIRVLPLGIEVLITQPLTIGGLTLALFSGLSSVLTISLGYLLLWLMPRILQLKSQPLQIYCYYVTLVFLLVDPFYISLISFFVGGDINGIAKGLNLSYGIIRAFYLLIALVNFYLVRKKLYPTYVSAAKNVTAG